MKKFQISLLLITFITNLNAQDYFKQAYNAYFNADFKNAEELYTKYLENNPNGFSAYYNRGLALFYQEKYGNAKKDFKRSIELCPKDKVDFIGDAQKKLEETEKLIAFKTSIKYSKDESGNKIEPKFTHRNPKKVISDVGEKPKSSSIKKYPTKIYNNGKLGDDRKLGRQLLRIVQKRECTPEIVEELLNSGADVNVKGRMISNTSLIYAIERQSATIVKMLIDAGANVNYKVKYATRKSVLHIAVDKQDPTKVKMLIDAGADINVKENFGVTPLLLASDKKNTTIVQLLLDAGADANLKDAYDNTPLHKAIYQNETMVKMLLDAGANINTAKDFSGATPLLYASRDLNASMVKLLLEAGADVNAKLKIQNDSGFGYSYWSSLDLAKYNEKNEVVDILLQYGAE